MTAPNKKGADGMGIRQRPEMMILRLAITSPQCQAGEAWPMGQTCAPDQWAGGPGSGAFSLRHSPLPSPPTMLQCYKVIPTPNTPKSVYKGHITLN